MHFNGELLHIAISHQNLAAYFGALFQRSWVSANVLNFSRDFSLLRRLLRRWGDWDLYQAYSSLKENPLGSSNLDVTKYNMLIWTSSCMKYCESSERERESKERKALYFPFLPLWRFQWVLNTASRQESFNITISQLKLAEGFGAQFHSEPEFRQSCWIFVIFVISGFQGASFWDGKASEIWRIFTCYRIWPISWVSCGRKLGHMHPGWDISYLWVLFGILLRRGVVLRNWSLYVTRKPALMYKDMVYNLI